MLKSVRSYVSMPRPIACACASKEEGNEKAERGTARLTASVRRAGENVKIQEDVMCSNAHTHTIYACIYGRRSCCNTTSIRTLVALRSRIPNSCCEEVR